MGLLQPFSLDQAAGACALVLGSLGVFALICFRSRCSNITVLWGCWSCARQVPEGESADDEPIVPPSAAVRPRTPEPPDEEAP